MPLARASELDRLLACPGSLILPREEKKSERAIAAAAWGTMVHAWKETGEIPKTRSGTTLRKKVELADVDRSSLYSHGLHEVSLAFNVLTSEVQALVLPLSEGARSEWKNRFGREWVVGTADYVGLLLDQPWVDDLKTGRQVTYFDHRYQQGFYSLAWTLYQMKELTSCRSTITHWPRYPITVKPKRFGTVLEPDFFLDLKTKLRRLYEDAEKMKGDKMKLLEVLSDGPQCTYCPSKTSCTKGQKYE